MNYIKAEITGDWDSTTLTECDAAGNEVAEIEAERLSLRVVAGEWQDGAPELDEPITAGVPMDGGIRDGGEMSAFVRLLSSPDVDTPVFPGRLEIRTPQGTLVVENADPDFSFANTHVYYSGQVTNNVLTEVTGAVLRVYAEVDYDSNTQVVRLYLFRHGHWLHSNEVDDIVLI